MKKVSHLQKGFTYVELILYIALITMVLMALVPFAWNVIEGSMKSSNEQDDFAQARMISERIKWEIRNAKDVQSVSAAQIKLTDFDTTTTTIGFASGNITLQEGAANPTYNLNSNTVKITSCTFANYTSADKKTKNIQFTFTVDENNSSARQEYKVPSVTIEGDAEIRSN